ncbi:TolC family protein [Hymenobacter profundi]|uniref:TolC family protein n=1 Tax=Hymenobacter profundi TaxID=1982110 RepID=A0ABS6WV27_9BACT|nr:hypothetical protein [Hymenobacter profundi]MBW3127157.1 hypothetical protein [Hymenobacter profundi]
MKFPRLTALAWLLPGLLASFAARAQPASAPAAPPVRDLAYYLAQAQQNSPLARDAQNQVQAAGLEAQRLRALYTRAQVTVSGNYLVAPVLSHDNGQTKLLYSGENATNYTGYDKALSNGALYQGLVQLTQPLFATGRYNVYAQQTQNLALSQQNLARLSVHDLEKLVADQYILCRQDLEQLTYVRELLAILNTQSLLVRKLVEASLLKQSDYTLLTIEQQTQQLALNTYRAAYRRDLLDLNVLSGIGDTTEVVLPAPNVTLQRTPVAAPRFLERYRLDSLGLAATQQVFELRYRPQASAFVNGGLNAVSFGDIPNRFGTSAGLSFSLFLFDGHQRELSRQRTGILLRSVQQARQNFQTVNPVREQRILGELRALEERQRLARAQLASYRSLLDSYKREVIAGQLSVINYVQVLKSYAAASRDLVLLDNNRLLLINAYNYWNW